MAALGKIRAISRRNERSHSRDEQPADASRKPPPCDVLAEVLPLLVGQGEFALAGHDHEREAEDLLRAELGGVKSPAGGDRRLLLGLDQEMVREALAALGAGVDKIGDLDDPIGFAALSAWAPGRVPRPGVSRSPPGRLASSSAASDRPNRAATPSTPSTARNRPERVEIRDVMTALRLPSDVSRTRSLLGPIAGSVADLIGDSLEVVSDPAAVRGRDRGLRRPGSPHNGGRCGQRGSAPGGRRAVTASAASRGRRPARALTGRRHERG